MHGTSPALEPKLPEVQEILSQLLGDPNEVTQEIASMGMSLVYEVGGAQTKEALLSSLVSTLSGQAPAKRLVKLDGASVVFKAGALGKAKDGGQLSTYKELCSLATELGNPELMYRFMEIANNKRSLSSRRGAAYGFARIIEFAGDDLKPYIGALVPKLYRMKHDPNPAISDAMDAILSALAPNTRDAVDEHLDAVMTDLLKEIGSRAWRTREACSTALADLLQARDWPIIGKYMPQMWDMCFRAMDDIKETVRLAAGRLGKSLSSATKRMCTAGKSSGATVKRDAADAAKTLLPVLLNTGLSSTVGEAVALAMSTMTEVVKTAPAGVVRPVLVELTAGLLESLSTLEDARMNYVEQHAERVGGTALKERLENARVSAAHRSPMGEALDVLARIVDETVVGELMPRLGRLCATGVGLNTRIGTLRFLISVTDSAGPAGTLRETAGPTMKTLYQSARRDGSAAERKARASAIAHLAKYAPPSSVTPLVEACMRSVTGDGDVDESRGSDLSSASIARELHRSAPDAAKAFQSDFVPIAFILRLDSNKELASLWQEVWEESAPVPSAAFELFRKDIVQLVVGLLRSNQWTRRVQGCRACESLAENDRALKLRDNAGVVVTLIDVLLEAMPGRSWEGKENLPKALTAIVDSCCTAENAGGDSELATRVANTLFEVLTKKTRSGAFYIACVASLRSAAKVFASASDVTTSFASTFRPVLLDVVSQLEEKIVAKKKQNADVGTKGAGGSTAASSSAKDDATAPSTSERELLKVGVSCLGALVDGTTLADETFICTLSTLLDVHRIQEWTVRLEALKVLEAIFTFEEGSSSVVGDAPPAIDQLVDALEHALSASSERVSAVRKALLSMVMSLLDTKATGVRDALLSNGSFLESLKSAVRCLQDDAVPDVSVLASDVSKKLAAAVPTHE